MTIKAEAGELAEIDERLRWIADQFRGMAEEVEQVEADAGDLEKRHADLVAAKADPETLRAAAAELDALQTRAEDLSDGVLYLQSEAEDLRQQRADLVGELGDGSGGAEAADWGGLLGAIGRAVLIIGGLAALLF